MARFVESRVPFCPYPQLPRLAFGELFGSGRISDAMATLLRPSASTSPAPLQAFRVRITAPVAAAILLCVVAIAARAIQFGNPVVQVDDQFYLLVGERMWDGVLPYVDIWDRKPIGLFLIFGAIRALGGEGVVQYQIVATMFAAATAIVVYRIAGSIASRGGATVAGIVYLASLGMFGGEAGQSPVFYNLPVALAALATIRFVERPTLDHRARVDAAVAMLLMGLAIQIKYTALFEGAYFGLVLLWRVRRTGITTRSLVVPTGLWVTLGVGPTALAWAAYAAIGHGNDFFFANFTSIFERGIESPWVTLGRLAAMAVKLLPLTYTAAIALWPSRGRPAERAPETMLIRTIIAGWALTAVVGVLVFGSYFDHYALPLLLPLSVAAAPVLGDPAAGLAFIARGRRRFVQASIILILFASVVSFTTIDKNQRERGTGRAVRDMAAFIRPRLTDCLFVYDGEPILYKLTGSCLPTRWAFPDHLNNMREDGAVGVDTLAETKRIMAGRPHFVVSSVIMQTRMNLRTLAYMQDQLARDYQPAGSWKVGSRYRIVYERLPGR